jgi:hypothetical protein
MYEESKWGVLPTRALRLTAFDCNEAGSDRTNGTMRRLLASFRLKMGREIVLSRLVIAKHTMADALRAVESVLPVKRGAISS